MIGLSEPGLPGGRQLPVSAVQGSWAVASTMPGRILPTGEPTPGNLSAAPKVLPTAVGGPNWLLNPGKPNRVPIEPGPKPKFGPAPTVYGYATRGWPAP